MLQKEKKMLHLVVPEKYQPGNHLSSKKKKRGGHFSRKKLQYKAVEYSCEID